VSDFILLFLPIQGGSVTDAHKYIETLKKSEYKTLFVLDEAE